MTNVIPLHTTLKQAQALYKRASELEATDRHLAVKLYAESACADDKYTPPVVALARLAWETGGYPTAERALRQALQSDPHDPASHFMLGHVLYSQANYASAVLSFRRAIALNPGHYQSYFQLAMAYEKLDEYRLALGAWEMYLKVAPADDCWRWVAENSVEVLSIWRSDEPTDRKVSYSPEATEGQD